MLYLLIQSNLINNEPLSNITPLLKHPHAPLKTLYNPKPNFILKLQLKALRKSNF